MTNLIEVTLKWEGGEKKVLIASIPSNDDNVSFTENGTSYTCFVFGREFINGGDVTIRTGKPVDKNAKTGFRSTGIVVG